MESEMKYLSKETGIQHFLAELKRNNYKDVAMSKESTE
jgi:hypothetical protein